MYRRILLPIDGSPPSEHAAAVGLALARRLGASVVLAHVIEPQRYRELRDVQEALERARTVGRALLEQWERKASRAQVACTTQLTSTEPESRPGVAEALVDVGVAHGCDLVVMGTHGRTGLPRVLLGSVAERMARLAPVPLLLVRGDDTKPTLFRRILVAIDGSSYSELALQHADALAGALKARLSLVYVVPDLTQLYVSAGRAWMFTDPAQLQAQLAQEQARLREQGEFILQEAARNCKHCQPVHTVLREAGRHLIGERIREVAEEEKAELIVMGTHGRTGLRKFLLGSVAEDVAQQARQPILLVRNPAALTHPDETHLPPPGER
ncbi:MAG: universal stress protein [Meiothermus sp.]|uniref:universal stress protein n=1 Tax=Meiothermus sp. TaxID=1955249 RepID=UPI0025F5D29D|nr:universal stress protein [Meiothermus sp.]MCS7069384.1 universal stress protein [Meiothermus sp.]MCX7602157.1 universal stress protein [Meiothermus sp.]MDW8424307.1 universal stress protein [Meiothermus sp.]